MKRYTFKKHERLTHRKIIGQLFEKGAAIKSFPVRFKWLATELSEDQPVQVVISVSKRYFKKAVDRNRIKRLIRESWRMQKHRIYDACEQHDLQLAVAVIYIGKELPDFNTIDLKISLLIDRLIEDIANFKSDDRSIHQTG
ncbi:MAG: ribonuclease P protein component [Flavobacteriales bacterium]|nr:ribonuclease P protein component [Flavobacteriales bacterium]